MTLDEFLVELYGDELSDMFLGNRNSKIESRGKLLPLINSAMKYAYAKYKIAYATTQLLVVSTETDYVLPETDILSVTRVINSYGRELTTEEVQVLGQTLHFPCPQDVELQVEYKTKPTNFPAMTVPEDEDEDPVEIPDEEVILVLPDLLVPWLRCYVASRIFMAQKTEDGIAKGTQLYAQAKLFENCFVETNTTNEYTPRESSKLCGRGFA